MGGAHPPGQETEPERVNRELIELRVALPGVQVLFAFLLALPFSSAFDDASTFERDVYFATLSCSALGSALLIAPSALHRLNFRSPDKSRIVFVSNGPHDRRARRLGIDDDGGDAADLAPDPLLAGVDYRHRDLGVGVRCSMAGAPAVGAT